MRFFRDLSFSALNAGFVTVLVGFASSVALVFQAAQALHATPAQLSSWIFALCLGIGLPGIVLSLRYRTPVTLAWSTAGAALLTTSVSGLSLAEATGAFVMCGVLTAIFGFSGLFDRLMARIPLPLAAAMLAGLLVRFGMNAFAAMQHQFWLVFTMLLAYLVARRLLPRYAVLMPLLAGIAWAAATGQLNLGAVELSLARLEWVRPAFSLPALIGVALPLFAVTMVSQNMPGLAVLRTAGYQPPSAVLIGWTGVATAVLAPFGAYAISLAAITAAICVSREAHAQPQSRYTAAVFAGACYLVAGLFGATVSALFLAFPSALVMAIAGLALLGAIGNSLQTALQDARHREAALVTFLVTASGLTLLDIGSAFWGMLAGGLAALVLQTGRREPAAPTPPAGER